jgi:ribosomal protein S4
MKGITGENLLSTLERRLDSVIYRMGLATSRAQGRQVVRHGHIQVNGRKVNIPSFIVKPGDEISVRESARTTPPFSPPATPRRTRRPGLDGRGSREPERPNHQHAAARRTGRFRSTNSSSSNCTASSKSLGSACGLKF